MERDYYKILGVSSHATATEIKKAYHELSKQVHPDLNDDPDATEKFKLINEANRILSDNTKRSLYDEERKKYMQGNNSFSSAIHNRTSETSSKVSYEDLMKMFNPENVEDSDEYKKILQQIRDITEEIESKDIRIKDLYCSKKNTAKSKYDKMHNDILTQKNIQLNNIDKRMIDEINRKRFLIMFFKKIQLKIVDKYSAEKASLEDSYNIEFEELDKSEVFEQMTAEISKNSDIDAQINSLKKSKEKLVSDRSILYSLLSEMKQSYHNANVSNYGFKNNI